MPEVLVLGADGYTGWPLVCRLLRDGYDVHGIDHLEGRRYRGESVTPIDSHVERSYAADEVFDGEYTFQRLDVRHYHRLRDAISAVKPDTIVNLAQIPSAPYSMQGPYEAWEVQDNNVRGALNVLWALRETGQTDTHVVQLATMGEYGTPDEPLPEGFLPDGRPAPKQPGSFYHASKVQMTTNTLFASETWEIPVTEIYQGIVYGVETAATAGNPDLMTRFDVDATFGTVLNRFTAQAAAGEPLTVYGEGGQCRAMLSLQDCVQCLTLAIENPPGPYTAGRYPYRAINQFDGSYRVNNLATMIAEETDADIEHLDNPRAEDDSRHFYDPEREVLDELGYEAAKSLEDAFHETYHVVQRHVDRIDRDALRPSTTWQTDEDHMELVEGKHD